MPTDIILNDHDIEIESGRVKFKNSNDEVGLEYSHTARCRLFIGSESKSADVRLKGSKSNLTVNRVKSDKINSDTIIGRVINAGRAGTESPEAGRVGVTGSDGNEKITLDGTKGSILFENSASPMFYVYKSGANNEERPIVAHSPNHPNWGISYRDKGDKIIFQGKGKPDLTINLNKSLVGVGDDDPQHNLHVNGTVAATHFKELSDARCKENIQPIREATQIIKSLQGVRFEWKKDACNNLNTDEGKQIGLLAQDVQKVLPEIVSIDAKGTHTVTYTSLIPVLIESAKKQEKIISEQSSEIRKLKVRLSKLEGLITEREKSY